ncbi:hypothetical protein FRB95_014106 [Tulasnella sp. JGI-2019a]|nr:hypothetical protein FRB95_014106 [Tulasnella sp. JGI-2019a]
MVDWKSPATLAAEGVAISKIDLVMLGMYVWECMSSAWFEIEVIRGKRTFKWPMLIYWWSKYFTFWFIVSINIMLQVTTPVNCMAMSTFIDFSGRTAIAAASQLLLMRSLALWHLDPRVTYPMILASFGQWAILLHNMFITKEAWSYEQKTCIITSVGADWTKVQFIYTMCFDFIVLCLALRALLKLPGVSSLWKLLFFDGLAYFLIAFTCYLAVTIVAVLDFNGLMMYMVSDPATIIATTAANRSFVRVFTYQENIISLPSSAVSTGLPRSPFGYRTGWGFRLTQPEIIVEEDAVRVGMETFTSISYPPPATIGSSPSTRYLRSGDKNDYTKDIESLAEGKYGKYNPTSPASAHHNVSLVDDQQYNNNNSRRVFTQSEP